MLEARHAEDGKTAWDLDGRVATKTWDVVSRPVVHDGVVSFLFIEQGLRLLSLGRISLEDGSVIGRLSLGTPASSSQQGWGWLHSSGNAWKQYMPVLLQDRGLLYVMTDGGAMLAVDLEAMRIAWALRYGYRSGRPQRGSSPGSMIMRDGVLYFRSGRSRHLYAIDVARRELLWRRSVGYEERLVGCDARNFYVLGRELEAFRRDDPEELVWSRRVKVGVGYPRVVLGQGRLALLVRGGLWDVDGETGDEHELELRKSPQGGSLLRTDAGQWICVTSKAAFGLGHKEDKDK